MTYVPLEELLAKSDIISLHCNLTVSEEGREARCATVCAS